MSQDQPRSSRALESIPESHELEEYPRATEQDSDPTSKETKPKEHSFKQNLDANEGETDEPSQAHASLVKNSFTISTWWENNIARALPVDDDVRDHFALERTYLAYIRTSNALASTSITIFQLSRLSNSPPSTGAKPISPNVFALEKAVTFMLICGAFLMTFLGAVRFLRGQKGVEEGWVRVGGGEGWGVGGAFVVVEVLLFVSILLN